MDLIDRQAAIKAVQRYKIEHGFAYCDCACDIERDLMALPSAQPEIIRCRDCRNYIDDGTEPMNLCKVTDGLWRPDDYCSYGRRRG